MLVPAIVAVLAAGAIVFAVVASSESGNGGGGTGSGAVTTLAPGTQPASGAPAPGAGGFVGAALPGDHEAPDFTLDDQYGRPISLSSLRGEPVVLTFLYAHCGAPCVLIAQQIRGALDELGAHPVPVLIVSADPTGDTPPAVRAFLAQVSLSGRVHYLTGTEAQLRDVWSAYGVRPASAGAATFAKYATVRLIDGAGRERVLYGTEQLTPEAIAHDVGKLRAG